MHVSAALPYAGGLPPSIFKQSAVLISAMKHMVSCRYEPERYGVDGPKQFTKAGVWSHRTI